MSKHNPPSNPSQKMEGSQQYQTEPVELERGDQEKPLLRWVVVENPDQKFVLEEDDYILDSYFNPEHDIWEVLIRLESTEEEDDD